MCPTLCNPMDCSTLGFPFHHQLSELAQTMSIESLTSSNHLILYCPLLFLPSIFPSIRVFSHESVLHIRWPKYWSFRFSISPTNEYSGLISFRIDWFDLLAVQGTLKSQFFFKFLDCKPLPFHTEGYERCFSLVKTLKKITLFCDLLETLVSKCFNHIPPTHILINYTHKNILKTGKS